MLFHAHLKSYNRTFKEPREKAALIQNQETKVQIKYQELKCKKEKAYLTSKI